MTGIWFRKIRTRRNHLSHNQSATTEYLHQQQQEVCAASMTLVVPKVSHHRSNGAYPKTTRRLRWDSIPTIVLVITTPRSVPTPAAVSPAAVSSWVLPAAESWAWIIWNTSSCPRTHCPAFAWRTKSTRPNSAKPITFPEIPSCWLPRNSSFPFRKRHSRRAFYVYRIPMPKNTNCIAFWQNIPTLEWRKPKRKTLEESWCWLIRCESFMIDRQNNLIQLFFVCFVVTWKCPIGT